MDIRPFAALAVILLAVCAQGDPDPKPVQVDYFGIPASQYPSEVYRYDPRANNYAGYTQVALAQYNPLLNQLGGYYLNTPYQGGYETPGYAVTESPGRYNYNGRGGYVNRPLVRVRPLIYNDIDYPAKVPNTYYNNNYPNNYSYNYPNNYRNNYPSNYPNNYPSNYPRNYPNNYPNNNPSNYPNNYPNNYPSNYQNNNPNHYYQRQQSNGYVSRPTLHSNTNYNGVIRNDGAGDDERYYQGAQGTQGAYAIRGGVFPTTEYDSTDNRGRYYRLQNDDSNVHYQNPQINYNAYEISRHSPQGYSPQIQNGGETRGYHNDKDGYDGNEYEGRKDGFGAQQSERTVYTVSQPRRVVPVRGANAKEPQTFYPAKREETKTETEE